jgi:hypothetical protein
MEISLVSIIKAGNRDGSRSLNREDLIQEYKEITRNCATDGEYILHDSPDIWKLVPYTVVTRSIRAKQPAVVCFGDKKYFVDSTMYRQPINIELRRDCIALAKETGNILRPLPVKSAGVRRAYEISKITKTALRGTAPVGRMTLEYIFDVEPAEPKYNVCISFTTNLTTSW